MGVNSTTYNATAAGYPINSLSLPNTTFIESTNGDIAIGSWGANAIHFVVNGTTTTVDAMTISSSGVTSLLNPLGLASGGTNSSLSAVAGAVAYSSGTAIGLTAAGTAGQVLVSGGSGTPTWSSGPSLNASVIVSSTLTGTTIASTITFGTLNGTFVTSTSITLGSALAVSSGGLGITTTPSNGQIPIGNGSTYTAATLTGTASQISVTNASGSITLSTPQNIGTASAVQFGSLGVGQAASATAGTIYATNNITAFAASDKKWKENIQTIDNAVDKVSAIGGKYFDWTEEYIELMGGLDPYFMPKSEFGVIAQDVQSAFPRAVRTREDGTLAVDYPKLVALAFQAIIELKAEIEQLKGK